MLSCVGMPPLGAVLLGPFKKVDCVTFQSLGLLFGCPTEHRSMGVENGIGLCHSEKLCSTFSEEADRPWPGLLLELVGYDQTLAVDPSISEVGLPPEEFVGRCIVHPTNISTRDGPTDANHFAEPVSVHEVDCTKQWTYLRRFSGDDQRIGEHRKAYAGSKASRYADCVNELKSVYIGEPISHHGFSRTQDIEESDERHLSALR